MNAATTKKKNNQKQNDKKERLENRNKDKRLMYIH